MVRAGRYGILSIIVVATMWGALRFVATGPELAEEVAGRPMGTTDGEAVASVVADLAESANTPAPALNDLRRDGIGRGPNLIRGAVRDVYAAPVADVPLRLAIIDEQDSFGEAIRWGRDELRSDIDGTFTADHLPDGVAMLIAESEGMAGLGRVGLFAAQKTEYEVVIVLEPAGTIGGRVIDETGDAVSGAVVFPHISRPHAKRNADFVSWHPRIFSAFTDSQGAFSVAPIFGPGYTLHVEAENFAPVISKAVDTNTSDNIVILSRGTSISGRVVSVSDQQGVGGIAVVMWHGGVSTIGRAVTDHTGAFTVECVPDGPHGIEIDSKGWVLAGQTHQVTVTDGGAVDDVVVYVGRGGAIEGRVYDPDTDESIPGVRVFLDHGPGEPSRRDGGYRIEGIRPGTYQIGCYQYESGLPTQGRARLPLVQVEFGGTHRIDIPIAMGVAVTGRVMTHEGTLIAGVQVTSSNRRDGSCFDLTRADGVFRLRGHRGGDVIDVSASKAGFLPHQQNNLIVQKDGLDDLALTLLAAARVQGRVMDSNGQVAAQAVVSVESQEPEPLNRSRYSASANAAGEFDVPSIEPAAWLICARCDSSQPITPSACQTIDAQAGEIAWVELELPPLEDYIIAGRVRDAAGMPQVNVQVWAQALGDQSHESGRGFIQQAPQPTGDFISVVTDDVGRFLLTVHREGPYRLAVAARGMQRVESDVNAGDTDVDLVVRPAGTIEGQLISAANGAPLPQFELLVVDSERNQEVPAWAQQRSFDSYYEPEGRFLLENIPPGTISIVARAPRCATSTQVVEVGEGETVRDVVIRIVEGATVAGTVRDGQGKPVPGARVFPGEVPEELEQGERHAAVSDALGAFTLGYLPAAATKFFAYHPDHALTSKTVTLEAGRENKFDLVLSSGGVVAGRVMRGRQPLAYARIRAYLIDGGTSRDATADDRGRYRISGLPPGHYGVTAEARYVAATDAHQSITREIEVDDRRPTNLDLILPDGVVTLEGIVTSEEPDSGRVFLSGTVTTALGDVVYFQAVLAAGEESFVVDDLPAGLITIGANLQLGAGSRHIYKQAEIDAGAGGVIRQDFHFRSLGALHVAIDGSFDSALVVAALGEIPWSGGSASEFADRLQRMGAHGAHVKGEHPQFAFAPIEQGRYTVFVSGMLEGAAVVDHAIVDVEGTDAVELELQLRGQ